MKTNKPDFNGEGNINVGLRTALIKKMLETNKPDIDGESDIEVGLRTALIDNLIPLCRQSWILDKL